MHEKTQTMRPKEEVPSLIYSVVEGWLYKNNKNKKPKETHNVRTPISATLVGLSRWTTNIFS